MTLWFFFCVCVCDGERSIGVVLHLRESRTTQELPVLLHFSNLELYFCDRIMIRLSEQPN